MSAARLQSESQHPYNYTILNVNGTAPDPLGILQVDSLYGPGSWWAWVLTLCAVWFRIITTWKTAHRRKAPIANLFIYLFFLDWATADFNKRWKVFMDPENDDWMKEAGRVGAALTVTAWGFLGGVITAPFLYNFESLSAKKLTVIVLGLIFPLLTFVSLFVYSNFTEPRFNLGTRHRIKNIPFLYIAGGVGIDTESMLTLVIRPAALFVMSLLSSSLTLVRFIRAALSLPGWLVKSHIMGLIRKFTPPWLVVCLYLLIAYAFFAGLSLLLFFEVIPFCLQLHRDKLQRKAELEHELRRPFEERDMSRVLEVAEVSESSTRSDGLSMDSPRPEIVRRANTASALV